MCPGSARNGACVPNPFENSPKSRKGKATLWAPRVAREAGSELAPNPAGAVQVVHGEGVGLRVEYPVFQGEHVIFREQKIEVPAPQGERREAKQPVSALGTNLRGPCEGPVATGAGRSEIPNPVGGLVPGKELWMPSRALSLGALHLVECWLTPLPSLCYLGPIQFHPDTSPLV